MRRVVLLIAALVIIAPDASVLTRDAPSRRAFDLLRTEFGEGHVAPLFLVGVFPGGALTADAVAAQYELGRRYDYGDGVPSNEEKAKEWYKKAADLGNFNFRARI